MPITLAQDPLPDQFMLPAETIASVIATLEWLEKQPEWFELRDIQYDQIDHWLLDQLKTAPEWQTLTEEQKDWSWGFVVVDGGLFAAANNADDDSFPIVSA